MRSCLKKSHFGAFVVACSLVLGGAVSAADIAGVWSSSEGAITFPGGAGEEIRAPYAQDDGRIIGVLRGRVLSGIWVESSSASECGDQRDGSHAWGRLRFEFDESLASFEGAWSYCDVEPHLGWSGSRAGRDCVPGVVSETLTLHGLCRCVDGAWRYESIAGVWGERESGTKLFVEETGTVIGTRKTHDNWRYFGKVAGRRMTGIWVEDDSNERCQTPVDGSYHWGRDIVAFDETLTRGDFKWGYCDDEPSHAGVTQRPGCSDQGLVGAQAAELPDFEIKSFAVTRKQAVSGGSGDYWEIKAEILNAGSDAPGRFTLRLEAVDAWSGGEPRFRAVANGGTSHPALAAGEGTTITWRTDTPTDTANRPNIVTDLYLAIRVVVDPNNEVEESDEADNEATLWRQSCADPVTETTLKTEVVWVELPEDADGPGPAPESYGALLDGMDDKAEAVLCRIKLEARRRAMIGAGSVAGSKFVKALTTHFLKDYLATPGREAALAAIATLGEAQYYPGIWLGVSMYVPRGLRQRYPEYYGDWRWIYPATQFMLHATRFMVHKGKYVKVIPYLDIPFLVGSKNLGTGMDADLKGGGKNLSNVMHWATGVKYWYLPKNALRELFIGYELWHLEGWDIFGEDAINDLIAEEAGRMLGVRLARHYNMRSEQELVQGLDEDFREARAWVGAMLRLRQENFDELILARKRPKSKKWWGWEGRRPEVRPPWPRRGAKMIRTRLDDGATVAEVSRSGLVERLTQVYTLIYEADEWERRHGAVGLTGVMRNVVEGAYDDQFKAAPKDWSAVWEWSP